MQPGKGTVDAVYIVKRVQESFIEKKNNLFVCFVDLEKTFDRVPRNVIEWALRKRNVPEGLVQVVMKLYKGAKTRVQVGDGYSEKFGVGVGIHQGSVLSPLLFAIVVDVLSEERRKGALYELLYADDLVLMADDDVVLRHTLPVFTGLGRCPIVNWDFAGAVSIFGPDALPVVHQ